MEQNRIIQHEAFVVHLAFEVVQMAKKGVEMVKYALCSYVLSYSTSGKKERAVVLMAG